MIPESMQRQSSIAPRTGGSGPSQSPKSHSAQPYISVSVTDPVKLGNGVQSYISYRITTKTNFPDYEGPEKIVIRRYSDFLWLHDRLFDKYKGIFIPPLPEKSAVEKFRFSVEFVEMRRQALDLFINRVTSHAELQRSEDLRIFLQADEDAMERARCAETGILKKKPADLMQIFKEMQLRVSDVVLGKERPAEESGPEYEKMKRYVSELEGHVAETQKHAYRLVKRHRELGRTVSEFGKAVRVLGEEEGLGRVSAEVASRSETVSARLNEEACHVLMAFEEPLKDYVGAVQSVKAAMGERAVAFRHWCDLVETVKAKEMHLNKLHMVRSDRAADAEMDYRSARDESEETRARFERMVEVMGDEMVAFQEQRTRDLGRAFHEFATGQARLAAAIAAAWRGLLPILDAQA